MGKRIKAFSLLVALLLLYCQSTTVLAQTVVNKSLLAEQAKGKAPNVKVYMTGSDMSKTAEVSGKVSDVTLSQKGVVETFEESGESIRYIILFDNSGSINKAQFDEAKSQLARMRTSMKNEDEMQIFTVGTTDISAEKTDVFGRIAVATEKDRVDEDCEKIENIEYIGGVVSKTILYRSLNEVLEEQSAQMAIDKLRTIVLLITDGEDDSDDLNGKDNDKDSTLANVRASCIPVYGILLNDTAREPNEEKIKFTKNQILDSNNSNGYYYNCSDKPDIDEVKEAFKEIDNVLRKETYIVWLTAETNKKVVGKSELSLTINNQSITPVLLDYSDYEKDTDAPVVIGIVEKEGRNSVTFMIEDENGVNLSDAGDSTHYVIQTEGDGKKWTIDQVNANQDGT
ncbi:MAG: VWA domain-containing protein, partial [Lachnospiraceae bacterium]|nr:VWA domain-containing protein [Lachnospiraceae bacterium]